MNLTIPPVRDTQTYIPSVIPKGNLPLQTPVNPDAAQKQYFNALYSSKYQGIIAENTAINQATLANQQWTDPNVGAQTPSEVATVNNNAISTSSSPESIMDYAVAILEAEEGFHGTAYEDGRGDGSKSIGYGTKNVDANGNTISTITEPEARDAMKRYLTETVKPHMDKLLAERKANGKEDLTDKQIATLYSVFFNTGNGVAGVNEAIRNGYLKAIQDAISAENKGGVVAERRKREVAFMNGEIPDRYKNIQNIGQEQEQTTTTA